MRQSKPLPRLFVDYMNQKCCWIKVNEHADKALLKHRFVVYIKEV